VFIIQGDLRISHKPFAHQPSGLFGFFDEPVLIKWILVLVQGCRRIVAQGAVFDNQRGGFCFAVSQEQNIVSQAKPNHHVKFRSFAVEHFGLHHGVAGDVARHADILRIDLTAESTDGNNFETVIFKNIR